MTDRTRRRLSLERSSLLSIGATGGGALLRFGLQVFVANVLGPTGFGRFVLARSWGEVLGRFANRGYQGAALKELPGYFDSGSYGLARGYVRRATAITWRTGLFITIGAFGVVALATGRVDPVLALGFAMVVPLALLTLATTLLQADGRFLNGAVLMELLQPALFALVVVALWRIDELTATTVTAAWLGTIVVVAVIARNSFARQRVELASAPVASDAERWTRVSGRLFRAQLGQDVLESVDVLLLGLLIDPEAVAVYAVALRLVRLVRIADNAVQENAAAPLSAAAAENDRAEMQRIVDRSLRLGVPISIASAVVTFVAAPWLVAIFGDGFESAATVLRILLIGNLVNSLTGPAAFVLALGGLEAVFARIMMVSAALSIPLVTVGVLIGDAAGAAVATAIVTGGWNLAVVMVARRELGVACHPRRTSEVSNR